MDPRDLTRFVGSAPTWLGDAKCNGYNTNPSNGDILCDTGALYGGYYDFDVVGAGSSYVIAGNLVLDWRDAPNTGFVWYYFPMFYASSIWSHTFRGIKINNNERWRWRCGATYTGILTTAIIATRRA